MKRSFAATRDVDADAPGERIRVERSEIAAGEVRAIVLEDEPIPFSAKRDLYPLGIGTRSSVDLRRAKK